MSLEDLIFKDLRKFKGARKCSVAIKIRKTTMDRILELHAEAKQEIVDMAIAELIPTWKNLVELEFFPGYMLGGDSERIARFLKELYSHCPKLMKLRFDGIELLKFEDLETCRWSNPPTAYEGWLYRLES